MKKTINIFACFTFVLVFASVSFANPAKKATIINDEAYIICNQLDTQCQQARKLAAGAAFQALLVCASGVGDACSDANDEADRSKGNAQYICDVFPDDEVEILPQEGQIGNYKSEQINSAEKYEFRLIE